MYLILILHLVNTVICNLTDGEITAKKDELKSFPCRGNSGTTIPSPFDNCNKCFCTKDEKVGGCTRMGCSKDYGFSNNTNNSKDYDIGIWNGQINGSSNNISNADDFLIGERVRQINYKKICKKKCMKRYNWRCSTNMKCKHCKRRCNKKHKRQSSSSPFSRASSPNDHDYQYDHDDQFGEKRICRRKCKWIYKGQCSTSSKCRQCKQRCNKKGQSSSSPSHEASPPNYGQDYGMTDDEDDQSEKCECGVLNRRARIVGGKDTLPNEFPWQIRVTVNGSTCGGSIISSKTVLTAAHCTEGSTASDISVVLGDHDRCVNDGEINIEVQQIIDHPNYSNSHKFFDNDFSLLILKKVITWNNKMRPICLPKSSASTYENKRALVTGWGHQYSGAMTAPHILQKAKVTTMENSKCIKDSIYGPSQGYCISSNMICANGKRKDACQGDSGGPLVTPDDRGSYSIIGVVSWGVGCAKDNAPGVYARVTSALEWIKTNMQGDTCPRKV